MFDRFSRAFRDRHAAILTLLTYGVAANGLGIVATPIILSLAQHHSTHYLAGTFRIDASLVLGLTLLYLSVLLRRRKRTAWLVTLCVYAVIFILTTAHGFGGLSPHDLHTLWPSLVGVLLPLFVLSGLALYRDDFTVKSDIRSFAFATRFIVLVMVVICAYGVTGFMLMDQRDFHKEVGVGEALHRTIDQFGLTTSSDLVPHTRRAQVFTDSLSILSTTAVAYAFFSLFQPIRARFTDQEPNRIRTESLLREFPASSEDFFKLWPHDKFYFFDRSACAALAYGVHRGVALAVGDPCGDPAKFDALLNEFDEYCRINDWAPAFVHTEPKFNDLYKRHGFSLQKLGEEAVLDLASFAEHTRNGKYFRQIRNRFQKQSYTSELLMPPHSDALLARLHTISSDWLNRPGREERRFMMGNFTSAYMQRCPIMVLRDEAGTIQAFINQIPSFDPHEANLDLLRHTKDSLGNSNDFIMMEFIDLLHKQGMQRLNLGLCPLAGLDEQSDERSVVDHALRFVYANGDRFYSFSGLRRFKSKYDPKWSNRYVAYRGGVRGFTRTMTALNRAMKV